MTVINYGRFITEELRDLLKDSERTEQDFQERLGNRTRKAGDAGESPEPDPLAMRLAFLVAKARQQRRAIEGELASRQVEKLHRNRDRKFDLTDRRTQPPEVALADAC
jgi:hypothetical protein